MDANMVGDRELATFRRQYYGLLAQLLAREPTSALLAALGQDIGPRAQAARALQPLLGEGWDELATVLAATDAEVAAEEFLHLFIGPGEPRVQPYESHYLAGALFRRPLVAVRDFLGRVGLERDEAHFAEPEDVLAFELEVMGWLIAKQLAAGAPEAEDAWLAQQGAFLKEHLLIWAPRCAQDIEAAQGARLYRAVAKLLAGFLELERQLFRGRGLQGIETVKAARRRYGARDGWTGPLVDFGGTGSSGETPEGQD